MREKIRMLASDLLRRAGARLTAAAGPDGAGAGRHTLVSLPVPRGQLIGAKIFMAGAHNTTEWDLSPHVVVNDGAIRLEIVRYVGPRN